MRILRSLCLSGMAISVLTSPVLSAPEIVSRPQSTISIPWGAGDEAVGIIDAEEMEKGGPLSFCVDGGKVLLLDSVNARVVEAAPGQPLRVAAREVRATSICPDGDGGFLVMHERQVTRYSGSQRKEAFSIAASEKLIEGYGSELLFSPSHGVTRANADQKNIPVAAGSAKAGFRKPAGVVKSVEGRLGNETSNLRYSIRRLAGNDVRILGADPDGKILVSVHIRIDDGTAGAVLFKGQDSEGRLHVELERIKGGRAELEVHRYGVNGERIAVYQMPNDYYTTVYKKTEIAPDGTVYQMLTTPEGVRILQY